MHQEANIRKMNVDILPAKYLLLQEGSKRARQTYHLHLCQPETEEETNLTNQIQIIYTKIQDILLV